jgi:hypothetical protein
MFRRALVTALIACSCFACAWDETGHKVVSRVAWDTLGKTDKGRAARDKFMNVLMKGDDAFLPQDLSDVEAFTDASTWADVIKRNYTSPFASLADKLNDETYPIDFPGRDKDGENNRCKTWHYFDVPLNLPAGTTPFDRPSNAKKALDLAFAGVQAGDDLHKAFWSYWILHVVGDLHQPLHCVSDFTNPTDSRTGLVTGDNGGNGFVLAGNPKNLHSYWDGAVTRATSPARSIAKRAAKVEAAYPESAFGTELDDLTPEHWIQNGAKLAELEVYKGVSAGEEPGEAYNANTAKVALRQAALAGYRMARLIEKLMTS